jgi:hypothetical protein
MYGDVRSVATAVSLSKATMLKIKQNLFWAFFYNLLLIPMAIAGIINPILASGAMATSSVSVVSNSLLLNRFRSKFAGPLNLAEKKHRRMTLIWQMGLVVALLVLVVVLSWQVFDSFTGSWGKNASGGMESMVKPTGTLAPPPSLTDVDAAVASNDSNFWRVGLRWLMLGLVAYHLLVVSPKMRQFAQPNGDKEKAGSAAAGSLQWIFRCTLIIELIVAVFLLAAAVFSPTAQIKLYQGHVGEVAYTMAISPTRTGNNIVELQLKDSSNSPIENPNKVLLRFIHFGMEMAVQELELKPLADRPGYYTATGSPFGMAGDWLIGVFIRRPSLEDLKWQVNVEVQN